MNRSLLVATTIAAFCLGVWHLQLGVQAILLFRNGEPLLSWVAMLCGPISTLPAVLLSCVWRKAAGHWLIAGAIISFVALLIGEGGLTESIRPFVWMVAAPMSLIGAGLLWASRQAFQKPSGR